MTSEIKSYIETCLTAVGFVPLGTYSEYDYKKIACAYPAFMSIEKVTLDRIKGVPAGECCLTADIKIRLLGKKSGFFGAEELEEMTEKLISSLYFTSEYIIALISFDEIKKNMRLGRPERTVSLRLSVKADKL